MAGEKLVQKALQAAMEARAAKHVADPAERAANLAKFQAGTPKDIAKSTWYHGSQYDVPKFYGEDGTRPLFLTTDPNFANEFAGFGKSKTLNGQVLEAQLAGEPIPQPNVTPVHVSVQNTFDYQNPEHIKKLNDALMRHMDDDHAMREVLDQIKLGRWSEIEMPEVQSAIRDLGHDSFYVSEHGNKNLALYSPEYQMKSATGNLGTFDPSIPRLDENRGGEVERALHLARGGYAEGGDPVYQSTGEKLVDENKINWGDPNEARDFFRADAERMRQEKAVEDARKAEEASRRTAGLPDGVTAYAPIDGGTTGGTPLLAAIRGQESSDDPNAQSKTSTAGGLFGFIDKTWANTLRRMNPELYGRMSDAELVALKKGKDTAALQQQAADFHLNSEIMPTLNKAGIPATPGNAYLGWFQGAQGAVKANTLPQDARVADVFPQSVGPNAAITFNGKPYAQWTLGDLRAWADAKMASRMKREDGGVVREHHAGGELVGKALKAIRLNSGKELPIRPSTDSIRDVMQATTNAGRVMPDNVLPLEGVYGGVNLTDPAQRARVDALKQKMLDDEGHIARVIVDHEGNVVEGQHRLEALRELGATHVPVEQFKDFEASIDLPAYYEAIMKSRQMAHDPSRQVGSMALENYAEAGNLAKAREMWDAPKGFEEPYWAAMEEIERQSGGKSHGGEVDRAMRVVREHHADGEAVGQRPPIFSYMPLPESAIEQSNQLTDGEKLVRNLGIEDMPKGETYASPSPTGIDKYLQYLPNIGNYPKRVSEAAHENIENVKQGYEAAKEGSPFLGALGMGAGALGTAMSPLTGAERVLVRDPYLNATGNLRDANAAEAALDFGLTGGIRGTANHLARGPVTKAFQTTRADPVAGALNIAREYAPQAAGVAGAAAVMSPDEVEAANLKKAFQIVAGMGHNGGPSMRTVYSDLSKNKHVIPVEEMSATHVPTDPMLPRTIIDPQSLQGSTLVNAVGDRTMAGHNLVDVNGVPLAYPVSLEGGPDFMRALANQREGAIWASDPAVIKRIANFTSKLGETGKDLNFVYSAMGARSGDFSHMMADALLAQMQGKPISKEALEELNKVMASRNPNWPGLANTDERAIQKAREVILQNGPMRKQFAEEVALGNLQDKGFPDIGSTRYAITEPAMIGKPTGMSGYAISRLDPAGRWTKTPEVAHTTYPSQLIGDKYLGGLEEQVPRDIMFPEFYKQRRLEGRPIQSDDRAFSLSNVSQDANQEWLDNLMKWTERKRRNLD